MKLLHEMTLLEVSMTASGKRWQQPSADRTFPASYSCLLASHRCSLALQGLFPAILPMVVLHHPSYGSEMGRMALWVLFMLACITSIARLHC